MIEMILRASSILIHNATIHGITVTFQPLEELQVVQRSAFNKPANFNMLPQDSHVKVPLHINSSQWLHPKYFILLVSDHIQLYYLKYIYHSIIWGKVILWQKKLLNKPNWVKHQNQIANQIFPRPNF